MKPAFIPFEHFVFRTPFFPFDTIGQPDASNSAAFGEALFLASPELFGGNLSADPKKQEKFAQSQAKYRQRAATRCTPFGLFAGCSTGRLSEETVLEMDSIENYKRCTRLDMQYLCALIREIESRPEIRRQLTYYPNDSLYQIGGKYRYIEYHYRGSSRHHNVVSLEKDEALQRLLDRSADGATVEQLVESLAEERISREEADAYIMETIDAQVLKSELDPCVVGGDVLTVLIDKLDRLQNVGMLQPLLRIRSLLAEIDAHPIGSTLPLYAEITEQVKTVGVAYEPKFLFQTDLFKPARQARIARQVTDRISALVDFLSRISVPGGNPQLSDFMRDFQNRYEEREVPLTTALDRELGLGYPSRGSDGDLSSLIDDLILPAHGTDVSEIRQTPADRVLLRKFVDCIRNGENTVELTDDDFKDFHFTHQLPDTLAVVCSLLDGQKLHVRSIGGSCGANLLGRFCHIDPDIENLVREIAEFEQQRNPDVIYAEVSHLPESRIGNIASRPVFRDCILHYLSNCDRRESEIPVGDLMLCVREGRLVLRSQKYGKEVIPRLTCAHNYSMSPIPVYRFLGDLQYQGKTGALHCGWNAPLADLNFLPRIEYRGIVLSRRQWKVRQEEVAGFDPTRESELQERFRVFREKRGISSRVVVPDSDNELYLDLENPQNQRMLLSLIAKRRGIILEEFLFDREQAVVRREDHVWTNEVIFVFHK